MQSQWKWATIAIVSVTIAIVFGPVLVPREMARWYLAAAANSFSKNDDVLAEHYLKQAVAWDADVAIDGDYWIAQLPKNGIQTADDLLDRLEKAIRTDGRWASAAIKKSEEIANEQDFQRAIRAMKMAFPDGQPNDAINMNTLAYYRSLAGIELKEALKDIDRAIEIEGKEGSYLDTKAWVLHGLHRDVEALAFINDAVKKMEKDFKAARISMPEPLPPADEATTESEADLPSQDADPNWLELPDDRSQTAAVKKRLGKRGWDMAVLRYHRFKILESLNMKSEAEEERQWLSERGVPISDEVF